MRTSLAIFTLLCAFSAMGQSGAPGELLQRGVEHYRAGRHAEAVADLNAAAQGYLSNENLQSYVSSGRFANLQQLETAFVYLALASSRLGDETAAREAIQRLMTAERIEPTYGRLSLAADAAEFEALAARLVPDANLGASGGQIAAAATPAPPQQRVLVVERMVEEECARIEREAEKRIAVIQREADDRVAAVQRAAEQRIAEIERNAQQRVATAEAARRDAEQRAAARPLPVPVPAPRPAAPPVVTETRTAGEWSDALRRAEELVAAARLAEANEIYTRITTSGASRDLRIRAAVALYRTGAFRQAVDAFARVAPFARGEEDLRYYFAVSLYEGGFYAEARHELSCALPFIRQTEDVIRYRTKIEQMLAWQNVTTPESVAQ
ncbi:MAG TPA: hypothetical protein VM779_10515 [Thermoanaerobaculia bacterium]|nr:hypothetical protein [Thermoanaerobaculia bacterium]